MRHLMLSCALLLAALSPVRASAATIEVRVTNVTGGKGTIHVAVCGRARFPKQCAYTASVPPQAGETVVALRDVPAGSWAVLAYQDENENKELDRNFLGIPTENYGFSRDAVGRFGPPEFDAAAIEVKDGTTVAPIRLH